MSCVGSQIISVFPIKLRFGDRMKEISLESSRRNELIDITSRVQQIVHDSGVERGFCFIFSPHTTAAITINEGADPMVQEDILRALEKLIPDIDFKHSEGNSDAHFKTSLVGASEKVPIVNRKIKLGRWQKIFFCEFDGPRTRKVLIQTKNE